ncbi:Mrp/NBP35 family ATP-binding protein [Alphaproteobacteria bacterium]|nr:Mrp/NBP35 family ATP-binding protein [Alphaproteobacteria bacterium]
MAEITEAQVLDALKTIGHNGKDLVSAGMISGVAIKSGAVQAALEIDPKLASEMTPIQKAAEAAIRGIPGVLSATVILTAESAPKPAAPAPGGDGPRAASNTDGGAIPNVATIIAVASGKGGVGKSTVAANLATALARQGLRIGLLDADIYGPSMPRMLGRTDRPDSPDGKQLLPLEAHGIKFMSIGLMVDERTPMIWRGPMVMSALQQMLQDVQWATAEDPMDILVLDMPPGTGDAQLTVAQRVPLAGAVIVSTPQDIALLDARRGVAMFEKVNVPVLGVVENMSMYICPSCGHEAHPFGHGGAKAEAEALGVPCLAEIPLTIGIREQGDAGAPMVVAHPDSPEADAFMKLAANVHEALQNQLSQASGGPKIVFD